MKKVVSVRLREEIIATIDEYSKKMSYQSRTDFLKKALEFYMKKRLGKS
ncbi:MULTISPECIES: ribbon-helix-helix domain-containing protein [Sulfolobaceae]|uniref:Ribbon-helix-helix protein, CopG family n=1 Tax=Sulfurisphaera tokodaii TaxID=111955 RepID=A0A832WV44_9CREN|nr:MULTISPECIES: ribbon-helix-helix domain-containing protein [Sulfolobaceae]QIW24379.1 ribbon-helix-helix protein, CopG family [Sulfolobus sp. S-194]HII73611.1 ribbon-helix-helix protein, CopG family [Sulfurisphaera tokodaii]